MKKVFSGAKETHPDIFRGGQRNSYQLEVVGQFFAYITWAKLSTRELCSFGL